MARKQMYPPHCLCYSADGCLLAAGHRDSFFIDLNGFRSGKEVKSAVIINLALLYPSTSMLFVVAFRLLIVQLWSLLLLLF